MIINLLMGANAREVLNREGWFRCTVYPCYTSCLFGFFFRAKARVLYCP